MKFSGIVYLYLEFTFCGSPMKSPLTATTFSSLDLKGLQALLVASLGMMLKTSMMVVIRDCFFVRGSVSTSPRYATL